MRKLLNNLVLFGLYLLLSFPLFYFVYKYGDPEPLAHDFFQYYRLYKDWDINNVIAPHNMRLCGAFFVHLLYELNFFYDTATVFDQYASWGFLKQVYFNAVFFNYLSVSATCVVIYYTLKHTGTGKLLSFTGGLLLLSGFGTLFYLLMPLTDAFSVFLFAVAYYFYLRKQYLVLLPLCLLVLQREYIFLGLGLLALIDLIYFKKRYYLLVLVSCVVLFSVYYFLRKTVFYTPALDYQSNPGYMIRSLLHPTLNWAEYLKQLAMTLNLFVIYLLLILAKRIQQYPIRRLGLLKLLFLLLQVNLVSIAGGHGNNVGRYFYLLVPVLIVELVLEAKSFHLLRSVNDNSRGLAPRDF